MLEKLNQKKISIENLFDSGAHFGHQKKRWNPKMKKYIYCSKNNIHIINLEYTMKTLERVCDFVYEKIKNENSNILFISTKKKICDIVKKVAENTNMFYITSRWLGGTLTNYSTIRKSIKTMYKIDKEIKINSNNITKKELSNLNKQSIKFHNIFDGIKDMKQIPNMIFVIDAKYELIAIKEAKKLQIPIIGIVDTDNNPEMLDYPIPSNDDSTKPIKIIMETIQNVIISAKNQREKDAIHKTEIKKPKIEIKSSKTEIKKPKIEIKSSKTEIKKPKIEIKSSKTEIKKPKIEIKSSKTEIKKPKIEIKSSKTEIKKPKIEIKSSKTEIKKPKIEIK